MPSISDLRNPNYNRYVQQPVVYQENTAYPNQSQPQQPMMKQETIETTTGGAGGLSAPMEEVKTKTKKKKQFSTLDIADTMPEIINQIVSLKPNVVMTRKALLKYSEILQDEDIF